MEGDEHVEPSASPLAPSPVRRRLRGLFFLIGGALVTLWFATRSPREQHVRFVLGPHAAEVTGLDVQYLEPNGEVTRENEMRFEPGQAPRIVTHEPSLTDGEYRLRIDVDTREGRRSVERQVTLSGGSTSVDLAGVISKTP
ncbi:hypothetical protein AKJ09_08929 [Labilithrix luteola]|uniref:Uncharacterized protein n=1 Tax=Labilithrix luteola TaxID=1391654 RepID=A0A0K1Q901_9BACT|nr:hypothetical protein [Labilithrix luteola]AKV02266.1 hypothetical protein AKJ09_08929 [Labilithrix luteola]